MTTREKSLPDKDKRTKDKDKDNQTDLDRLKSEVTGQRGQLIPQEQQITAESKVFLIFPRWSKIYNNGWTTVEVAVGNTEPLGHTWYPIGPGKSEEWVRVWAAWTVYVRAPGSNLPQDAGTRWGGYRQELIIICIPTTQLESLPSTENYCNTLFHNKKKW